MKKRGGRNFRLASVEKREKGLKLGRLNVKGNERDCGGEARRVPSGEGEGNPKEGRHRERVGRG